MAERAVNQCIELSGMAMTTKASDLGSVPKRLGDAKNFFKCLITESLKSGQPGFEPGTDGYESHSQ